jgi:hypothetical protein
MDILKKTHNLKHIQILKAPQDKKLYDVKKCLIEAMSAL